VVEGRWSCGIPPHYSLFPTIDSPVRFLKTPSFGTSPCKLLKDRSRRSSYVELPRSSGIGPDKLLGARCNSCKLTMLPRFPGMLPFSLLSVKFNRVRPFIFFSMEGMLPCNEFPSIKTNSSDRIGTFCDHDIWNNQA
jgi:hypothetical protein